jgi:hypothetical protein
MSLYDDIVDEAERLVLSKDLPVHASREEIAKCLSMRLHTYIDKNSTGAMLAEAAYNRYSRYQQAV